MIRLLLNRLFGIKTNSEELGCLRQWSKDQESRLLSQQLFGLANKYRLELQLPPLRRSGRLTLSAFMHAARITQLNEFAHTLSDGVELGERVRRAGYDYAVCRENIARYDIAHKRVDELAVAIHDGWVNSPCHRENLEAVDVEDLGVGVVRVRGRFVAVQNFGVPLIERAMPLGGPVAAPATRRSAVRKW